MCVKNDLKMPLFHRLDFFNTIFEQIDRTFVNRQGIFFYFVLFIAYREIFIYVLHHSLPLQHPILIIYTCTIQLLMLLFLCYLFFFLLFFFFIFFYYIFFSIFLF